MKKLFLLAISCLLPCFGAARPILVEAEGFADTGGWVIDPRFMDLMGSPYRHDADGDGLDEIYAISFFPSPSKRTWSNEHNGGSWSHAMPGGHEGIRRQIDLDGNGCADFIMPFGAWHWGSDSILFLMEGGTNK